MKTEELPRHQAHLGISPEIRKLREKAPDLLVTLVPHLFDEGVFSDIQNVEDIKPDSITALMGGINSAAFWIDDSSGPTVVKLQTKGAEVEAEWLEQYRKRGISVPRVKAVGIVPGEEDLRNPVRYIALEGITNNKGKQAKTGREEDFGHMKIQELSVRMGVELAKIHQTVTDKQFGNYAYGADRYASWAEYLISMLPVESLSEFGIDSRRHRILQGILRKIKFPARGVHLHGDFHLHNLLIESTDPLQFRVIDPSGVVGDPYYDLAIQANRKELKAAVRHELPKGGTLPWWAMDPTNTDALLAAYQEASGIHKLDKKRLSANQIAAHFLAYINRKLRTDATGTEVQKKDFEKEMNIRRQLLKSKIDEFMR